jgi:cytochrome c oxidase accessory protein FixG
VDCNACVAVCPAGIDIRDGQQLECITCALCIDACDSVMEKVGSPKGLISYSTLRTYDAHKAGGLAVIGWRAFLRPRTFVYTAIWLAVGLAMFYSLLHRERLDVNVLNDRNPLYVKLSDGSIRNGFTVKILNMEQRPRSFVLSAEGLPASTMTMTGGDGAPLQEFTIDVEADKLRAIKVYIAISPLLLASEQVPFEFKVIEKSSPTTPETRSIPVFFHAPPKETTP